MNRTGTADELTASPETGWWNDDGIPAPWPTDFPQNWRPETRHTDPEPGKPAF
ncbi:MAG: hypothetical protein ACOH2F_09895 [Cellulomonas sp.]